jgi:hypothetical protein
MTEDRAQQARKAAERPELQIISRSGEELAADALTLTDFQSWSCNDYVLAEVGGDDVVGVGEEKGRCYVVLSPKDVIIVKPRDRRDRVAWLVERTKYAEALEEVERIDASGGVLEGDGEVVLSASEIGQRYIEHLVHEGQLHLMLVCLVIGHLWNVVKAISPRLHAYVQKFAATTQSGGKIGYLSLRRSGT